jgi:hypothetical protein
MVRPQTREHIFGRNRRTWIVQRFSHTLAQNLIECRLLAVERAQRCAQHFTSGGVIT